ncbi:MAG: hypothetical protein JO218_06360 [Burkholderiales bacterium]|nr:hypothetical protein [Burkholderiales bacterium]
MHVRIPRTGLVTAMLLALSNMAQAEASIPVPTAQTQQQAEVATVASHDLAQFIQRTLEKGDAALAGGFPLNVRHVDELRGAKLGTGFPVFTIDARRLVGGENDLSAMATPTGSWRFMIVAGAQPIGMATVDKVGGHWQTVAFGAATLSQEVSANLAAHSATADGQFRFIRIYQAESDLLEFGAPGTKRPRYALLQSAQHALFPQREAEQAAPMHATQLMNQEDFIEPLRQAAQANMAPSHGSGR